MLEVGRIISHYEVVLPLLSNGNDCLYDQKADRTGYSIIGINENKFVLDDENFTRVSLKKDSYITVLNEKQLTITPDDKFFSCIRYSLYTDRTKTFKQIAKEIKKAIVAKYSFLSDIDLTFITEQK